MPPNCPSSRQRPFFGEYCSRKVKIAYWTCLERGPLFLKKRESEAIVLPEIHHWLLMTMQSLVTASVTMQSLVDDMIKLQIYIVYYFALTVMLLACFALLFPSVLRVIAR